MKKTLTVLISAAAVVIFLCAAPSFIRTTISSENQIAYEQTIPSVAHGYVLSQQFIPQYDGLERIEIYINALNCDRTQGYMHVQILDAESESVYENTISLQELPTYGMTAIAEDVKLHSGNGYCLMIEAVDTVDDGPVISFYPTVSAASKEENGFVLSYNRVPLEGSVLRVSFYYSVPLSPVNDMVYCLFIVYMIFFASSKISFFCKTRLKDEGTFS